MQMERKMKYLKKVAYPYEKFQTIDSFSNQLTVGKEDYFYTLRQSYTDSGEILWAQAMFLKKKPKETD